VRIFGLELKEISLLHWSTAFTAFLMPCFRKMVAFGIGLMVMFAMGSAMKYSRKLSLKFNVSAWITLLLFCVHFIGLNKALDFDQGLKELEIKLSYFVFPVILFFGFEARRRVRYLIGAAFILGCLVRIPISVIDAAMVYNATGNIKALGYEMLSDPYHPSYMAFYQSVAVMMILGYIFNERISRTVQFVLGGIMVIMLVYISMLASRAGLISAVMCIVMGGILYLKEATNRLERIFVCAGCMVILIATSSLLPTTSQRIEALRITPEIPTIETAVKKPTQSSLELRLITWKAALNVLLEHPFGAGTSNTEKELVEEYMAMGETNAAEKKLNAHNQWLQMGAEFGWIGLLLIAALFITVIHSAYRQRKYVMMTIAVIFVLNCIVESMLEVQAGIVFFCFLQLLIGPAVEERTYRPNEV
jgi:O-antigen ligase